MGLAENEWWNGNSFYKKGGQAPTGDEFVDSELKRNRKVFAPSQEVVLQKGREIKNWELRACYFFQALTAARISEALAFKQGDMQVVSRDRHRWAMFRVITLKNKHEGFRTLPIPLFKPIELEMFEYFKSLYDRRVGKIFPNLHSRNNVWKQYNRAVSFDCEVQDLRTKDITNETIRLFPHLLRHFRLTYLVTLYHYDAFKLQRFAGWSSVKPAAYYINLSAIDLMQGFL